MDILRNILAALMRSLSSSLRPSMDSRISTLAGVLKVFEIFFLKQNKNKIKWIKN